MNRFLALVVGCVCAISIVMQAQVGFTGKWQGSTPNGQAITLELKAAKQQLTGKLTVGQESADITEGTVEAKTLSFTATIEGRTVMCSGRLIGDELEFAPQGVPKPVMLKRAK